jgi:DNA-binding NarL/FixJ family response regulator
MSTAPAKPRIKIALVEDREVVRMGLKAILQTDSQLQIVGEADSVATGVELCVRQKPDVVLLDLRLPMVPVSRPAGRF